MSGIKEKFLIFYETKLLAHFSEEEKILVHLLPDNPHIIRMCEEHVRMNELYSSIKTDDSKLGDDLFLFGELLEAHIRFEERELFPLIEQHLTE
ncbi:MAG: hemerythrin domain-containing protein [Chlorobi bacterium]|nr:hemerythrin domain-containing protein [Chlorobiota bacterium]MCI0714748.1 hemerythrin domain-containing protein [Chlorobiota bacterium]